MFDVAILGSGFAASVLAMVARRQGLTVLLIERGLHPRFAIGESTSPMANLLLEELAHEYDLPRLLPLTQYGPWKRAYPELNVGLKRGFSYYAHRAGEAFRPEPERSNELLVAASPTDELADTHWYRPDFDHFLLREAQGLGAEYVDRTSVERVTSTPSGWSIQGAREGRSLTHSAHYLVDATGPRGALSRLVNLSEAEPKHAYPPTQALFSHFTGVHKFADQLHSHNEAPPFPPDAAALHHVFEGGWLWVLPFDDGITSAGFAVEDWLADELGLTDHEGAWQRFLDRFPSIRSQFQNAEATLPLMHAPRLSYRCERVAGPGWALLPSAAGFVDPLFSTGFPLTLLGIHRLARELPALVGGSGPPGFEEEYERVTRQELEHTATLVHGCYRSFDRFSNFAWLTMLYFAAASYGEMARRLSRPDLSPGFLMQGQSRFRKLLERHCAASIAGVAVDSRAISRDLDPFNIAGLCDPAKRGWYGVDLDDVVRGAAKLETTPDAIRAFFHHMGWA